MFRLLPALAMLLQGAAPMAADSAADASANAGTTAMAVGGILVLLYLIRKLKTVSILLFGLFAFFLAAFVIMAVPQLHIEPIYSILVDLFTALPSYVGDTAQFFRNLLGAI